MAAPIAFTLLTLAMGWCALLPLTRRLEPGLYHLSAFPVGLLGWGFVASLSLALRTGYSWPLVAAGVVAFSAGMAALLSVLVRAEPAGERVPAWSFLAVAALAALSAGLFARWGVTAFSHDGWAQYGLYSWPLSDAGRGEIKMLAERMLVLPAFHAAYHRFGGEFATFVYPLLSLNTALAVGFATYRASCSAGLVASVMAAIAVVAVMISHVTYLFLSIYVHSHMASALFLLLGGIAIWMATEPLAERLSGESGAPPPTSLLAVAGLATAGVWLTRPDGPAYAMAIVVLLIAVGLRTALPRSSFDAFFAPWAVLTALYTAATIANRGLWTSHKISATLLGAFVASSIAIWAACRFLPLTRMRWLARRRNAISLVLALEAVGLVWLFRVLGDQADLAIFHMTRNLLEEGGWRSFWPLMAAMLAITVLFAVPTGRDRFTTYALFYAAQFFVIAFVVHGVSHPGRIGWGDSFNRVAFHVVPLLYWYLGLYVGGLLTALRRRGRTADRS